MASTSLNKIEEEKIQISETEAINRYILTFDTSNKNELIEKSIILTGQGFLKSTVSV